MENGLIRVALLGLIYGELTALFAIVQWIENRRFGRDGPHWAPVWWIALTWPFWLVALPFMRARRSLRGYHFVRLPGLWVEWSNSRYYGDRLGLFLNVLLLPQPDVTREGECFLGALRIEAEMSRPASGGAWRFWVRASSDTDTIATRRAEGAQA